MPPLRKEAQASETRSSAAFISGEPHTVRLVGGADHRTKVEISAASAEQKRVRSLETVGGGKRTMDSGSKIRNVASCVARASGIELSHGPGHAVPGHACGLVLG